MNPNDMTDRQLSRAEGLLDQAVGISQQLDGYLREETHTVKLLVLSCLVQTLGGHDVGCDGDNCPLAAPRMERLGEIFGRLMTALFVTETEAHLLFASLLGGLALRVDPEFMEDEE